VASARPSALDPNAGLIRRYAPGGEAAFLAGLDRALAGDGERDGDFAEVADYLREAGEDIVIIWGERYLDEPALRALLSVARRLGLADHDGAGLLEIPAGANGRGLREAGVTPGMGPGYGELAGAGPGPGRGARQIARAAADGDITALYLFHTDPLRDQPDRTLWEQAMHRAGVVVAHASILTEGLAEHANVIFPAESHAEKEGTVVHPDGRLQRMRTAIAHPGEVRSGWSVVAELAKRAGLDTGVLTSPMVFKQLVAAVPFYGELTLEEIGGRGVRWHERAAASAFPSSAEIPAISASSPGGLAPEPRADDEAPRRNGALRLGTYRPIWAAPEVEVSPALKFTVAQQQVELAPEDAQRLGVGDGEAITVSQNGTSLRGVARVRTGVPGGTAFLADGLAGDSANAFTEPVIEVHKR
jgi:NADH-quinone oxidoreductase subunit G